MSTTSTDLGDTTSFSTRRPGESGGVAEAALVRRAQNGDLEAFEQLMGLHVRRVRTFLALRAPAQHLIDELTHETFVFAYKHLHDFTAGSALAAWLRAIAGNLLRAEVQRFSRERHNRSKFADHLMIELARRDDRSTGNARAVEILEECLSQLDDEMRDLVTLKYHRDCSAQEIADQFGRSVAWVRTTLFRVRQRLKDDIETRLAREDNP